MADAAVEDLTDSEVNSRRNARKCAQVSQILMREEYKAQMKKITEILKKDESERSPEDRLLIDQSPDMVKNIEKRNKLRMLSKHRVQEVEDDSEVLSAKCLQLAQAIRNAKSVVLYTGAGISTAASIPDYRGPSGVWTLLQQGIQPKVQDLSHAEPTYTHMAIKKLHQMGVVKYVVSQNCDGLHLRSGLPRHALSELHGNMFIELCQSCNPPREYLRLFDVTERTGVRKHQTGRFCTHCKQELRDSIVHFGERSPGLSSPYNWEEAAQAADQADLVLCIGSSLKVLRKYPCLWSPHKPPSQKPDLYIINLQWTPKDDGARLKINGKCDTVLKQLLHHLGLTADPYNMNVDPIYCLAEPLTPAEADTTTRNILKVPKDYNRSAVISSIEHEKLRFMERKMKKGKKKKGSSSSSSKPMVFSNFYEEDYDTKPEDDVKPTDLSLTSNGSEDRESSTSYGSTSTSKNSSPVKSELRNHFKTEPPADYPTESRDVFPQTSSASGVFPGNLFPAGSPPPFSPLVSPFLFPPGGAPLFPPAVETTSSGQDQTADSIKFHQTLQMLQLQAQLHLHQQALTQQLPASEQARVLQQQDLMRQAFNTLLVQQLMKIEEKKLSPKSSTDPLLFPAPMPPGGPWPQTFGTSPLSSPTQKPQGNHRRPSRESHNFPHSSFSALESSDGAQRSELPPPHSKEIKMEPDFILPPRSTYQCSMGTDSFPVATSAAHHTSENTSNVPLWMYPSCTTASQAHSSPRSLLPNGTSQPAHRAHHRKRKSLEAEGHRSDSAPSIEAEVDFSSPRPTSSDDDRSMASPLFSNFSVPLGNNDHLRVEGLNSSSVNPMISMQSRLSAEDDKPYLDLPSDAKMKSALEFPSLLNDPAFKATFSPLISPPLVGFSEPQRSYEETQAVSRNLALVESVLSAECDGVLNEMGGSESSAEASDAKAAPMEGSPSDDSVSNPGWFGKGWNPKKFRKKKRIK